MAKKAEGEFIDAVYQFFQDRPALNKSAFCKEVGISKQYLDMILKRLKPTDQNYRRLTDETKEKLLPILKKYGY